MEHTIARLLPISLVLAVVAVAGCGSATDNLVCMPACPAGAHCTDQGCVTDTPKPNVDMAVPTVDAGACNPACQAPNAYCNPAHLCVPCLVDAHCPIGQICKTTGGSSVCVAGCADDSRCAAAGGDGGVSGMKCCAGQCLDTTKDPQNCGKCGTACGVQHSSALCLGGACKPGMCDPGWGDCNKDPKDGCEANLHIDPANCTGCGMACVIPNAVAGCSDGCYIAACNFGFDDCDGKIDNGCETSVLSDLKNCGGCGMPCGKVPHAQSTCVNAACQLTACDPGFSDCDGDPKNGCEVVTGTDVNNCGKCGNVCAMGLVCNQGGCTCPQCNIPHAKSKCVNNQCAFDSCVAGWSDCDMNQQNGCEVNTDNDPANCGACGMACPKNLPGCSQGKCVNAWYPMGVQNNVPVGTIAGWSECYRDQYSNGNTPLKQILGMCTGSKLMIACSPKAANVITALAWAPRADVIFDTGVGNVTHNANGVEWYYNDSESWGFATGGDTVSRNSCDTNNNNPDKRICWHTSGGNINGGWRCGAVTSLNGDNTWDRIIYQIP